MLHVAENSFVMSSLQHQESLMRQRKVRFNRVGTRLRI